MPRYWETGGPGAAAPAAPRSGRYWDPPDPAQLTDGTEEDHSLSSWFTIPNGLRIGGAIAGGLAGSFIPGAGTAAGAAMGGAAGAGLGEGLAEFMEVRRHQRQEINPWQVGTQAAIGAIPLGKIGSVAAGVVKGSLLGAGATAASSQAERGWHMPDIAEAKDIGYGAVAGGVFGGAASGVLNHFARPRVLGAGAAAEGARPLPGQPPAGSPFRSAVSPRFESFEPPPTTFPDPAEMAMAYQPNLPGSVKAGGRRMGGFNQGDDELQAILRGDDPSIPNIGESDNQYRPRAEYAFHQPGFEAGDPGFPMYHVLGGEADKSTVSAETLREMGIDVPEAPRPPGPFPSRTRPLIPSGLDEAPPAVQQQPLVHPRRVQEAIRDYITAGNPERAAEVAETIASEPGAGQAIIDYLRQQHGEDIPVYRAGEVVPGRPQSWTTKRSVAETFAQPQMHGTAEPRPITEGTVRPEDVLFPGAETDHELVIDGGKVTPRQPGREGHFTLPETKVPDDAYEALRDKLGIEPSPDALAERRTADVGPPPGSPNRRVRLQADTPVLDEAGRELAPPQTAAAERPPGPWDRNRVPMEPEPAPNAPTAVRTGFTPHSGGPSIQDVDPATVGIDAKTYQFKGGGDASGVTDRLKGVESWDPIAGEASPLIVHERANGQQYVVDGHQRLGLAKRLKADGRTGAPDTLRSIMLRERDGVTVNQARRIGAMLNLQQGTGSATDVAKVLRESPLTSLERSRIPKDQTSGAKLRMGEDLAKLGDDAFLRVINGQVHSNPVRNEAFGAIVGRNISDHAEQVAALQQLAKAAPENAYQAEQFVKAIKADGFERGVQTNLFGEQEVANSLADPIARIMTAARRTLQSDKSALGNALRNEERLTGKGNVLNREANQAGFDQAGTLDRLLDTYGHTAGPVREELKRVASAVQAGDLTPAAAASQVLEAVERERGNLGAAKPPLRAPVQPNDGPGGPAPAQPPAAEAAPPIAPKPPIPELPELPQASPAEVPGILEQLAKTINVKNKPLVDEVPFSLGREVSTEPAAATTRQANIFEPAEESAAGARKVERGDYSKPMTLNEALSLPEDKLQQRIAAQKGASSDLPAELKGLDELQTRHEVRNPKKASEISASMKRVGWKGRPILTVKSGDRQIAWTGTHRLEAAKQAGLKPSDVPRVEVDGAKLAAAGYDVDELTRLGKKERIAALRKAGEHQAAELLEEERAAKQGRERREGSNPRAQGTNPRALRKAEELLDAGKVDEAERLMSSQIEARIQAALKRGTGENGGGSTLVGGLMPFDTETFRRMIAKHPESAWKATTTAIGGATGWYLDEDHPGRGVILGMLAGAAAGSVPRFVRALQTAETKGRVAGKGVEPVRLARDPKKDIGLFELIGGTPERTIPDQFAKALPAYERFVKALREEHARTKAIIPQKRVQAIRDRYVTPVITDIRRDAAAAAADKVNRQPYKASYITAFANRLAGHRTFGQRVLKTLTSKGPLSKLPADFIERRVGDSVYYTGTGYAVDTALQNLTQPALALAHVPAKFLAQAYKDLATSPAAKRLVEGALMPLEKPTDVIETVLGPFGQKASKFRDSKLGKALDPQKLLRMTDNNNRQVVYYAARKFAESRGLETAAADTWARQVMRKTQAEPGALGTNPFHAGPVMGSLRPFTKFPTVYTEHAVDVVKQAARGKNLGGAARLGAALVGIEALKSATDIDTEDLLVSGGRPLGFDIQHPARSLERIITGQATPASRGVFDLLGHLSGSADHSLGEDAYNLAVPRYVRKVAEAVEHFTHEGPDQPHVTRGPGGKIRNVTTPGETVLNLLGAKTTRQTDRQHALTDFYDKSTSMKERYEADRRKAYEDLSAAIDSGDHDAAGEAIRRIGSSQAVRQFLKERRLLPEERFFKTLPPKLRQQLRQQFEDTRDLAPGAR